ncbi:unnamed protein product [Ectocarpus sp. CCAP 1310/34]|nr:unnamed protein product [Ectocarpus sp. CCAP 1310/34]
MLDGTRSDGSVARETIQQEEKNDQIDDNRSRLLHALDKTYTAATGDFELKLSQSLDVVRRALNDFGGETGRGLAISFNGGKDACVVLYLLLFVLAERDELWRLTSSASKHIPVVYFEKEEFPEIDAFMQQVSETYQFEFQRYSKSYKDGMQDLVESHGIKAVIMGQRRGDPWTEDMEWFTASTPGWAEFTRVNPALEWKFCHVWRLLRGSGLPYCVLYDQGYTSLGERGDTSKNEALRLPDGSYRPAYELAEEEEYLERSPRTPTPGSPRSPSRVSPPRERDDGGGGDEGNKRFSSWDEEWDSSAGTAQDRPAVAADDGGQDILDAETVSSGESVGAGKALGIGGRTGPSGNGACLPPPVKERGEGSLVGWVGSLLPVTTIALALVAAAVGVRSTSGSSRGGVHDNSAPHKGD